MEKQSRTIATVLTFAALLLFLANICFGTVRIPFNDVITILTGGSSGKPSWDFIVLQSRIPSAITAVLAGMSLSASGLMLQTAFRNPLAGPDILGINGGAGLGVAIVMMMFGGRISAGSFSLGSSISVIAGAFVGAVIVMSIILLLSSRLKRPVMLLIAGIMVSYLASSVISLLNFFASAEGVHSYTMWGMGNFGGVPLDQIPFFTIATSAGLVMAILLIKPLNALLLGDFYAENLGISIRRVRTLLLLATGILVAVTTAFCGPVSFIGLAVPHMARLMLKSGNHLSLMPVTILTGAVTALLCSLISSLPGDRGLIPINAITPVIGAPVIIWILLRKQRDIR
ncbi:MAG: iron ABC transporter permease [Bacteroidaceae bacterium]|nr:iron ABC transporter permease [Bacteroidaceae bacterium]